MLCVLLPWAVSQQITADALLGQPLPAASAHLQQGKHRGAESHPHGMGTYRAHGDICGQGSRCASGWLSLGAVLHRESWVPSGMGHGGQSHCSLKQDQKMSKAFNVGPSQRAGVEG